MGTLAPGALADVAILDPAATVSPGYEQFAGVMPPNFGSRLTAAQLEALVGFLAAQR